MSTTLKNELVSSAIQRYLIKATQKFWVTEQARVTQLLFPILQKKSAIAIQRQWRAWLAQKAANLKEQQLWIEEEQRRRCWELSHNHEVHQYNMDKVSELATKCLVAKTCDFVHWPEPTLPFREMSQRSRNFWDYNPLNNVPTGAYVFARRTNSLILGVTGVMMRIFTDKEQDNSSFFEGIIADRFIFPTVNSFVVYADSLPLEEIRLYSDKYYKHMWKKHPLISENRFYIRTDWLEIV